MQLLLQHYFQHLNTSVYNFPFFHALMKAARLIYFVMDPSAYVCVYVCTALYLWVFRVDTLSDSLY